MQGSRDECKIYCRFTANIYCKIYPVYSITVKAAACFLLLLPLGAAFLAGAFLPGAFLPGAFAGALPAGTCLFMGLSLPPRAARSYSPTSSFARCIDRSSCRPMEAQSPYMHSYSRHHHLALIHVQSLHVAFPKLDKYGVLVKRFCIKFLLPDNFLHLLRLYRNCRNHKAPRHHYLLLHTDSHIIHDFFTVACVNCSMHVPPLHNCVWGVWALRVTSCTMLV